MKLQTTLKELIKGADITPTKLSKATGVPLSTLHGWLNGIEPKSITQLKSVSELFGISLDSLCFGFEEGSVFATNPFKEYEQEINIGQFEVILRKRKAQGE